MNDTCTGYSGNGAGVSEDSDYFGGTQEERVSLIYAFHYSNY